MRFRSDSRSFSKASGCAVLAVALVLAARVQAEPPHSTPAQRPVRSIQEALRLGLVNDQKKPVVGEQILRAPRRAFDVIEGPPVGDGGAVRFRFGADSFCSGFEPPCTLGYIGGGASGVPQNCEWRASNCVCMNDDPPPSQPVIDNTNPSAGDQHLHFEFDPSQPSGFENGARNWAFSDPNIPNPPVDGVMTLDLMLYINEPGGLNAYHVRPQAPSQSLVTAEMVFMPSGDIVCFEDLDPDDGE
ncbi:MAG: hypothetical protein IIB58_11175, partial [Planctomycetes bacterium]|nr:hypothetical protein [Planctomycetota bacterium]